MLSTPVFSTLEARPRRKTLCLKRPRRQMGQQHRIGLSRAQLSRLANPALRRQQRHSDLIKRRAGLAERRDALPSEADLPDLGLHEALLVLKRGLQSELGLLRAEGRLLRGDLLCRQLLGNDLLGQLLRQLM